MSEWTPELKAELVAAYLDANPTPENSMEIVAELAKEYDKTVNGVRIILTQNEVYVKKAAGATKAAAGGGTAGAAKAPRVSKADAIADLSSAIVDAGQEVDSEIVDKLTGKAAQYFAGVLRGASV